ncbi:MAG: TonB-dependent receptor, partial [Verrucomicrobiota bacterium]
MKTHSVRARQVAASSLLLTAAIMAHGQAATNVTTRLPEVVIRATPDSPSLTVPSFSLAREQIEQIPGGANIVDAEDIKRGRASTLKDALDFSPGVLVQNRFGAEEARISVRGSGLQRTFHGRGLKLMQDGVPLNLADGSFDMQAIEPLSTRYIEVFRGANGLRYGSTTLGGAVNFVAPTGHDAAPFQARVEAGSFQYLRGQASSGQAFDRSDYYASFTHFSQEGFRDHSSQNNQRVFSNLGYKLRDDAETRFYFTYVRSDSQLPGSLTKAQMEANPRQANPANLAGYQKRDFELIRVANKTAIEAGEGAIEIGTFWSHKDLFHPIFQVIDQNSHDVGINARYHIDGELFGRRNQFTIGLGPTYGWLEDNRFLNVGGQRGARTGDSQQISYNLDLYAENQHYLNESLALVAGVQLSQASREFRDSFLADGNQSQDEDYFGVNPKLGLRYEINDRVQLFGNVSRSFEPPSFGELVRPALGPVVNGLLALEAQTATTVEIGTRGEAGRFAWDLAVYRAWIEDELLSFQLPGGPPGATATINASSTIHQGVELGLSTTLWEGITTGAGPDDSDRLLFRQTYLWSHFRFQDDGTFGNNQLPGLPEHYYRGELLYEHPSGFYVGPNVEWSAVKYPIDMANTFFADPYALVGVKVGYRTKKGFSAFFEVRNLADKVYAATTGVVTTATPAAAQFLPGDGRAFYGGIE